jgi:hypothetical protein
MTAGEARKNAKKQAMLARVRRYNFQHTKIETLREIIVRKTLILPIQCTEKSSDSTPEIRRLRAPIFASKQLKL